MFCLHTLLVIRADPLQLSRGFKHCASQMGYDLAPQNGVAVMMGAVGGVCSASLFNCRWEPSIYF